MKILIATDNYIYNLGGVTASVLALCAGLRRAGHEVRTLSLSNSSKSFRNGEDYYIRSFPTFINPDFRLSFAMRDPLIRELESWKPDIIHVQSEGSANIIARRIMKHCGVSIVQTCHTDYGYYIFGKFRSLILVKGLMNIAGKIVFRHATKVTVPSPKAVSFPFVHSACDRLTVIPNGMEIEKYRKHLSAEERKAFRLSMGIGTDVQTLVTVSRLSKEKNIRELISFLPGLLARMADVRLLIVGDGPDKKRLEKLTGKLGLSNHVIFTGRIPAADVWRWYDAGDVYVSASTFEVHSMSHLEALANGLPMLCRADSALDGVLEQNRNGLAYHSQEEFTDFACKLLKDDLLREDMARCSAQKAEEFSSDVFAASFIEVYEEAIRENKAITHRKDRKGNGK